MAHAREGEGLGLDLEEIGALFELPQTLPAPNCSHLTPGVGHNVINRQHPSRKEGRQFHLQPAA